MYLTNLPENFSEYGLCKLLMIRKNTIYLKHIQKNMFVYNTEQTTTKLVNNLNMSLFEYQAFLTNKLRMIYKIPRDYKYDMDKIVHVERQDFFRMIELYRKLPHLVVIDFDKTLTVKRFHDLYNWLNHYNYKISINSANGSKDSIVDYLIKHNLEIPKLDLIFANGGKKRKITRLKDLCVSYIKRNIFYIDDEIEYLNYGVILGCYCYQYKKEKIKNYTFFRK